MGGGVLKDAALKWSRPTCGVELHELQVLAGKACPGDHGCAVTGAGVGRRAAEVGAAVASGKQTGSRERTVMHREPSGLPL